MTLILQKIMFKMLLFLDELSQKTEKKLINLCLY
jgi:hypothetical protein